MTDATSHLSALVVDDEPALAEELAEGLRAAGIHTVVATSGKEAERILAIEPDIGAVVTDVRMPGDDGFSLARRILAKSGSRNARRIVLMTGQSTLDDASAAVRAGAFDYVRKPFALDDMIDVVSRALDAAQAERLAHQQQRETVERLVHVEAERAILRLRDPTTGLPNALALEGALNSLGGGQAALLMLRLEGLQFVTDVGRRDLYDGLLVEVARRFGEAARTHALYQLHDAAHFAVLARGLNDRDAEELSRVLLGILTEPVSVAGQAVGLTAAIGIALSSAISDDTPLDACAQVAMAEAVRQGGGRLVRFSAAMHGAALRRLRITQDLPLAAARGELALLYQPLRTPDLSRLFGFEALMRWTHPVLGPVRPDEFIGVAEETGAILALGAWALDTATRQAAAWRRERTRPPYIGINVSGRQLQEPSLSDLLQQALTRQALPGDAIVIEVTETVAVTDAAAGILQKLRSQGLRIALDDFGAGYSSLGSLRRLPVDIIKFDRALLPSGPRAAAEASSFKSLVGAVHDLGFSVVAEGIESEAHRTLAVDAGVDAIQGYLIGRPMPAASAKALAVG